jgi:acyl-CoA dehydrogenase
VDFAYSPRTEELLGKLESFMADYVYPAESVYDAQVAANDNPHEQPQIMRDLQAKARELGLWNLFMTHDGLGAGLTNLEYAPLAEIVGRSIIGNETINCSAPDTGNMEILAMFGTDEQKAQWLKPLLDCSIRSARPWQVRMRQIFDRLSNVTVTNTCSTAVSGTPPASSILTASS